MRENAPYAAIAAAAPGTSQLVASSEEFKWTGLHLERHRCSPGPRASKHVDRPVLILLCSPFSKGEHRCLTGDFVPYRKQHGTVTSIPEGPASEIRLLVKSELAFVAFQPDYLASVAAELVFEVPETQFRSGVHDSSLSSLFHLLLYSLATQDSLDRLYVDSLTHAMAIRFLRWNGASQKRTVTDHPIPTASKLHRLQEFISANLASPLDLETLAGEIGYTRAHFARWFRASTGRSVHAHVVELRLARARQMLAGATSLAEIAAACGFAGQSHMTSLFRRFYNTTPAAMPRMHVDRPDTSIR